MQPFKPQFTFQCDQKPENMESRKEGKYCQACAKTLVDFTKMSDAEIIAFFKRKPQKICGIMRADQQKVYYPASSQTQRLQAKAPFWPMAALALGTFAGLPWASSQAAPANTHLTSDFSKHNNPGFNQNKPDTTLDSTTQVEVRLLLGTRPCHNGIASLYLGDSLLQVALANEAGKCTFSLGDTALGQRVTIVGQFNGYQAEKSLTLTTTHIQQLTINLYEPRSCEVIMVGNIQPSRTTNKTSGRQFMGGTKTKLYHEQEPWVVPPKGEYNGENLLHHMSPVAIWHALKPHALFKWFKNKMLRRDNEKPKT